MTFAEYRFLLLSDLYRITRRVSLWSFIRQVFFSSESYRYNFWLRTCQYTKATLALRILLHPFAKLMLRRLTYRWGISIPEGTNIGSGFYICHFGGIVVNGRAVIGKNCNISQGVTLGQANRGRNRGYPRLGDGVYIGPGAKIVGAVTIGNNVAIGANCVVTTDVADDSVVVGIPGRVVSLKGAAEYVNNTDYQSQAIGEIRAL